MKNGNHVFRAIGASSILLWSWTAIGGPLTPPVGPITSTGTTIDEVSSMVETAEPRIAVNATNTPGTPGTMFTISAPGSYFLEGNIVQAPGLNGITIAATNVTLDLQGFNMSGAGTDEAILIVLSFPFQTLANIRIQNGTISSWGIGILSTISGVTFEDIDINGSSFNGFDVMGNTILQRCSSSDNGANGLIGGGASVQLIDCNFSSNGLSGVELLAFGDSSILQRVTANSNAENGIGVGTSSIVSECIASFNGGGGATLGNGIIVGNSSTVVECSTFSNIGNGIFATSATGAISSPGGSSLISRCTSTLDASPLAPLGIPGIGGIVVESGIVEHCTVDTSGGDGILAFGGFPTTQIIGCNVLHAVGNGIHVSSGSEVRDCSVTESELNGILVNLGADASRIIGNTLRSNGTSGFPGLFAGIHVADLVIFAAPVTGCLIDGNYMVGNGAGLILGPLTATCTVIRNIATGNPFPSPGVLNYVIGGGPHDIAPIGPAAAAFGFDNITN